MLNGSNFNHYFRSHNKKSLFHNTVLSLKRLKELSEPNIVSALLHQRKSIKIRKKNILLISD